MELSTYLWENDLSQQKFAELANLSIRTINKICCGEKVGARTMYKVKKAIEKIECTKDERK